LKAFSILLSNYPDLRNQNVKLVLIGSVRDNRDKQKVSDLQQETKSLEISEYVQFVCDAPWEDVVSWLGRGWIGTNAMWNEHFGIGVVEYMAAGLIPVVHNSGGPKMDIVTELDGKPTGTCVPIQTNPKDIMRQQLPNSLKRMRKYCPCLMRIV
jgi:alpha-1,2-mannosyltransferase